MGDLNFDDPKNGDVTKINKNSSQSYYKRVERMEEFVKYEQEQDHTIRK